ncbi:Putative glyoxalase/Bleomycin resistance protein/Dihydroxybiphenyl dioxygenase [Septoria linicola]|uniref:Glyoxalase/Bleomycin resistance protein/Dihydroxybiphenyl dioxygenase n=1 Tax=Septoria linicola TaxID=215465 RepID=A0A9Q9B218_9PEZI|nr:putative glyoxalase/Bleomycin resistance protein/Dihydroxybiphenyl dioxygenase [Septoria linicola]USW55992.1 Putative glyoxalase/Bleomycin resistance protein/Dihydroxybiphenyl dioxygenase [Septoria linicola]
MAPPSAISHVLELCLYVKDIHASNKFYTEIMGLTAEELQPAILKERMSVFPMGNTTLLLFALGQTDEDVRPIPSQPDICIPKHGPEAKTMAALMEGGEKLRQHYCLAVETKHQAIAWERYLKEKGVECNGRMEWPRGGYSVYFLDPDGHVGEVASRGIWAHY